MNKLTLIVLLTTVLTVLLGKKNESLDSTDLLNQETFTAQTITHLSPYLTANANSQPTVPGRVFGSKNNKPQNSTMASSYDALQSPPPPRAFYFDFEAPIKTILMFCPSSSISCEKEILTPTFEIGNECCLPCDCSDRCYTAGTCCAEMTNGFNNNHHPSPPFTKVEESCVNTFITGGYYSSNSSYLLFQHCTDNKDNQTKKKCLYPDVFKLDEIMPVYSETSNRHYRNVFCAKCNNDEHNVLLWKTRLSCNDSEMMTFGIPQVLNIFSILDFISANPSCGLVSDPPSHVKKVDRCFLEENIVSNCNNPNLASICKQYYAPVKAGSIIYRNVFCMECANFSNFTGLYDACYSDDIDLPKPFTCILSPNINQSTVSKYDTSDNNICPFPKMYNDKTDSCIHYTCAVTEIKVSDACHTIFLKLMNIHLEYRLKLIYRAFTFDIWESLPLPLYDSNIMAALGISHDNLCFTKPLELKVSLQSAEISAVYIKFVSFVEATDIKQAYKDYEESIKAYNEKAEKNENMVLLQIDKSDIEPILEDSVALVKFARFHALHNCHYNIAMTKLQFCDTISFHNDEFIIHDNGNISIDNLMFAPGEFVIRRTLNGTIKYVQVCLNDYISIHNNSHSVASTAQYRGNSQSRNFVICVQLMFSTILFILTS